MEFVNFELAKKLKEKGFDYPCIGHYVNNELFICHYINAFHSDKNESIDLPTISQVLNWLGDEKQIYILVEPFPSMATKDKVCWSWSFKRNSDGINIDHTFPDDFTYLTSKEAALAGIEYVFNNMI